LPTLAFQLANATNAFKSFFVEALKGDPRVVYRSLSSQLQGLITTPLLKVNPNGGVRKALRLSGHMYLILR
jgi:hypothetical protein